MTANLIEVDQLEVHFRRGRNVVRAVDEVSLSIAGNEVIGIVGETACGKSTLARAIAGLVKPTRGEVRFEGLPLEAMPRHQRLRFRRAVQMVFQDPLESLNPRKTIGRTLRAPLTIHDVVEKQKVSVEARRLLEAVGLAPAVQFLARFPHQISGGQRQRVGVARALAPRPSLVVCDEPVSNLDVTVQAQIITLLANLRDELNLAYVIISHDLNIIRTLSNRVFVMYLGQVVEEGTTDELFRAPGHPYSAALLAASPLPDPVAARQRRRAVAIGEPPSPVAPPAGCRYHPRCPFAEPICLTEPPRVKLGAGHWSSCHFATRIGEFLERYPVADSDVRPVRRETGIHLRSTA
jgi:oligopeptide/dipeptide ABC transporter ATP-binding protein